MVDKDPEKRIEPEAYVRWKPPRKQFNNRIPEDLLKCFEEFGNDKKYLLEYLIWFVCKYLGSRYLELTDLDRGMLERYVEGIKKYLIKNPDFEKEYRLLFSIEEEWKSKLSSLIGKNRPDQPVTNDQDS
ncbi:MAG: hypothetical protein ACTSWN_05520 [Promethearchaeota archaeon]